jgi:hypothetical protein
MVGDSSGHREGSLSKGTSEKPSHAKDLNGDGHTSAKTPAHNTRDVVMRAVAQGKLDKAQGKALSDLLSRMGVLGFENRRMISVMITNIALEGPTDKRTGLVLKLREYLEGDGLAKDLVPVISGAFALK